MSDSQNSGSSNYVRLSLMMFLQFAVWGAWSVIIAVHMDNLGFSGTQIGLVFGTTAFGSILAPMIAGWIADRFMPSQTFVGFSHLVGAALLYLAWKQTEFVPMWTVMFLYALTYMPTIALTNAIAFTHMKQAGRFGDVRLWGAIGWICVGVFNNRYLNYWEHNSTTSHAGDVLIVAAVVAVLMGLYSFTLPNTPPTKNARNPYAFLEAFQLTKNRNFAVLLTISFLVAIELPFYYNLTPTFFKEAASSSIGSGGLGMKESLVSLVLLIGQCAEIAFTLALWPTLKKSGMKWVIFMGILAWPLRYIVFAVGKPSELVIASQALHGMGYAFFFVAGMIAVERLSPKEVRASAQSLMLFATNGLGMLIGHFISGPITDHFKVNDTTHHWAMIFMLPIVVTIIAAVIFALRFDQKAFLAESDRIEKEDAALEAPAVPA